MFILRLLRLEFAPAFIPTVAAVLVVALTISLGRWQLSRAAEKQALQQRYLAMQAESPVALTGLEGDGIEGLQFRPITAEGEFDSAKQIYLDNQVENERAGYHVLTPLKLQDGRHYVLVNRGWIARGAEYPAPPNVSVPAGRVQVQGYGALPVKRFLELSAETVQGNVWQNVTFERYRRATGLDVTPIILVQTVGNPDGLMPIKDRPDFGITKHQGYALQWFALSVAVVAIYLFVNARYVRK